MNELIEKPHKSANSGFLSALSTAHNPLSKSKYAADNPRMTAEIHNNTLLERIDRRLDDLGLSAQAASLQAGLSKDFIRGLKRNPGRSPSTANLDRLARVLQTSTHWLLTGQDGTGEITDRLIGDARRADIEPPPLRHSLPKDVKVLGTAAGSHAGGAFQLFDDVIDFVRRPPGVSLAKDVYALYVEGESMEPQFFAGDLIYVNPHRPARPSDIVVVIMQTADGAPQEATLGVYLRKTEKTLIIQKRNPPDSTVDIERKFVKEIHRVLPVNELYGV